MNHACTPISLVLLLATLASSSYAADLESNERPKRGKPPQAAFDACTNISENDRCAVSTSNGDEVLGVCRVPSRSGQLVCVPDNHPRGGRDREHAKAE
jgi:hypothetical protein